MIFAILTNEVFSMTKKILLTAFAVITILTLTFSLIACNDVEDDSVELSDAQKQFYSTWLSNIEDPTPIKSIALLGSHDSGTSEMSSVVKAMSMTQSLTIGEQLLYGTRYFDIRVNKKSDGSLNIFHGVDTSGGNFLPIINDIVDFIAANPSEFLVLDFQHFNNGSQSSVIDVIESSELIDLAVKNEGELTDMDYIDSLTLEDVRGKVIITWGSNEANGDEYSYLFRRNNDSCSLPNASLDSMYFGEENSKPSKTYIEESIPKYMAHIVAKNKALTVLQGQLTSPNLGNLKNLENGHNKAMSEYVRSIADNKTYLDSVNIIMRDFIGSDIEKTNSVLYLNLKKNNVKSEATAEFEKFTKK